MTLRPDSRARNRSGIRRSRRLAPCHRHPTEPATGICASCLRERLSGLDAAAASPSPELRRCRSVVTSNKFEASSSSLNEPRRKSCDVVSARSSLCGLFDVDDLKGGSEGDPIVESKNVGLSRVTYTVIESKKEPGDEIRVSTAKLGESNLDSTDIESGEFKTMKEYIDLEFQNKPKKPKDSKGIAGNLIGAASVFTRKLRNWRQKNNNKNISGKNISGNDRNPKPFQDGRKSCSEIVGRRSCDTSDACGIPFEEPRASWDGYMIARTIPRLAPMFSGVENGILGNMNKFENRRLSVDGPTMHSIVEDESSSGASGSAHSNSDSTFSVKGSSFDRSSSVRSFGKKANGEPPANMKLVITEKELKDWHLGSHRDEGLEKFGSLSRNATTTETVVNLNRPVKKPDRWRKVCNVIGFGPKSSEKQGEEGGGGNVRDDVWKLTRSSSVVGRRNSCDVVESSYRRSVDNAGGIGLNRIEDFKVDRNGSGRCSPAPFYMTPVRGLKHCKSGKFKVVDPGFGAGNGLE